MFTCICLVICVGIVHLCLGTTALISVYVAFCQDGKTKPLETGDIMTMTKSEKNSAVSNQDSKRADTGDYTITISNRHGSDSAKVNVVVLGKWLSHFTSNHIPTCYWMYLKIEKGSDGEARMVLLMVVCAKFHTFICVNNIHFQLFVNLHI